MKKTIIAISILVSVSTAFAWGPREQGALAGVIAGVVINDAIRGDSYRYEQPRYYAPAPQYYVEPPRYVQPYQPPTYYVHPRQNCWNMGIRDYYGNVISYQLVCR